MVTAELSYNPYLRETIIKFNKQNPRINSQIEKFVNCRLYEWIENIPEIYHDEMNGYDFEFIFSGTKADFERIRSTFNKKGISENNISFTFKNELDSPTTKNKGINDLIKWLEDNKNRRFDFNGFKEKHKELFDEPYTLITVNSKEKSLSLEIDNETVHIENVDDISELTATDLTSTPLLLHIDTSDIIETRKIVQSIVARKDIYHKQIFFYIDPSLNVEQIERIISDLGVSEPNIVSGVNDDKIKEYFETFPLTDYIKDFLDVFRTETDNIQKSLNEEILSSKIKNNNTHNQIESIEYKIVNYKRVMDMFNQRDNYATPVKYEEAKSDLITKISNWRKRKIKTTSNDEAISMAEEYSKSITDYYTEFVKQVDEASLTKGNELDCLYEDWYNEANTKAVFDPLVDVEYIRNEYIIPEFKEIFLKLNFSKQVEAKGSIFGKFKPGSDNEIKETYIETTYVYDDWRKKALEELLPYCNKVIDGWNEKLIEYAARRAEKYSMQLQKIIDMAEEEKNILANLLSEDEQKLQKDIDWLTDFKDRLHKIERE